MTMPTTPTTANVAGRVAAGVTAEFVLDLSRRSARAAGDDRRGLSRRRAPIAPGLARVRDDCPPRGRETMAA
jgi:hypothetical protein